MLKNKYQRLNKDERKKARDNFYQTEFGKSKKNIFLRLLICGSLLLVYALYLVIDGIIHASIWNYIAALLVTACALVFLIGRHKILVRDVNNYLIKKK